jgi:hypothetical protein
MYGPYYESLAAVPTRDLSTYLPGRDKADDAKPMPVNTAKHEGFLWDKKEFGFEDVLDMINPLQHIPLISSMYRESSGDTIGAVPRVLGDALYGGGLVGAAMGAGMALVNVAVEAITGKDVGGTMMALINGEPTDGTAIAEREAGTTSTTGGDAAAATKSIATTAAPGAVPGADRTKPDNAKSADTEMPLTPAEELNTFPGVNTRSGASVDAAKAAAVKAAGVKAATASVEAETDSNGHNAAPAKDATDKSAQNQPAATKGSEGEPPLKNFGGALGGAAPSPRAAAPHKANPDNAWVTQNMMSGLEKYRSMAREQTKKPASVDGVY